LNTDETCIILGRTNARRFVKAEDNMPRISGYAPKRLSSRVGRVLRIAAALVLALWLRAPAFANDANPVPKVPKGDAAMEAAFARAAGGLDGFFAKWRNPPRGAEHFSVKIGLADTPGQPGYALVRPDADAASAGPIEWFWTNNLRADGDAYTAELNNDAEDLHNVAFGQVIHFSRSDIGDWIYYQNGKIIGNATACPALAHASAAERRQMKEQYGLDCD
jgi:uncharacterized protein YegJ (DUF2314 family)